MSKKKTLLTILAVMLVCCIAVTGTLAVLFAKTSEPVVNTFTAAGDGKLVTGEFTLKEHIAVKQTDGSYKLTEEATNNTTTGNHYDVLPKTDLPKDPYITITGKTNAPAYLYVEVVDGLPSGMHYAMADCWTKLDGVTGNHKGVVYVYNGGTNVGTPIDEESTGLDNISIIKNDTIKVDDVPGLAEGQEVSLSFYAYLGQASVGTPAQAYTACFGTGAGA